MKAAEQWKTIEESNQYSISNFGRVRNIRTGRILKPRPTKTGYQRVHLPVGKGRKDFYIHRLVADAFCKHHGGCDVVNHIDNNVKNNSADNLEWTTTLNNVHHGMKQKRYRLNAKPVVGIKDGNETEYISAHQAAVHTGCDHSSIIKCCAGRYRHTHGYQWKYAEVI